MSKVRIYSGPIAAVAHIIRSDLESEGIKAEVRNELTAQLAGVIPLDQCMIEVWVKAEDEQRSREVIKAILKSEDKGRLSLVGEHSNSTGAQRYWMCVECGEDCPENFVRCWSCGAYR